MAVSLTDEQREALRHANGAIELHDDATQQDYMLLPKSEYLRILQDGFTREIQLGIDQADHGEVEEWDVEAVISEARRRYAEKHGP